ncbi:poly(R)-hydroxyalkanoic acid synthase subunit PhaE [Bradyrhizobium sp.]|jgi:polyhydroxyalkanoate synthesis regulator phasin|uniref:poly(R)-hydroxyalkanoic acid synthase subunit PhaE n=1 Tax=Bradyrhizobium sp. TaxID=376 RepID=UPI003C132189
MSEQDKSPAAAPDHALEWARLWQTMAESSNRLVEAWSGSMAPFMLARISEKPVGFGDGNELSATIERMAQGPQLADAWDIDRKLALAVAAWIEMRQRLASYSAVASAPWTEASKRFVEAMSATGASEAPGPDWREAFAKWSEISKQELIRNQRADDFLKAQKELLQAGLQLRSRQDDVADSVAAMLGLPTRKDFDEVTRQLTELRREVRALERPMQAKGAESKGAENAE